MNRLQHQIETYQGVKKQQYKDNDRHSKFKSTLDYGFFVFKYLYLNHINLDIFESISLTQHFRTAESVE
jgi:hypothetical protein